jgi:hypothetical protein
VDQSVSAFAGMVRATAREIDARRLRFMLFPFMRMIAGALLLASRDQLQ